MPPMLPRLRPFRWTIVGLLLAALAPFFSLGRADVGGPVRHDAPGAQRPASARPYPKCGAHVVTDCVVDGDTFRLGAETVRVADIDAPETGGARCESEALLGARATVRLAELLGAGPFSLKGFESRDRDRYGRLLRVVVRDNVSIGQILISEGLARRWEGKRRPWC